MVWEVLLRDRALAEAAARFAPDVLLGVDGTSIAPVGKALGIPVHVFSDREDDLVSNWLTFPRVAEVITPEWFGKDAGKNHVTYPGFQPLAYLHPARFRPDPGLRRALGVSPGERLSIVRFACCGDRHGRFQRAIPTEGRRRLVGALLVRGPVLVSADGSLPPDLEELRLPLPPPLVHHALAAADVFVGEGATMALEAAVLGTPAVYSLPVLGGSLLEAKRRSGLVIHVGSEGEATAAALDILDRDPAEAAADRERRRRRLLEGCVDLTGWMARRFGVEEKSPERRPALETAGATA